MTKTNAIQRVIFKPEQGPKGDTGTANPDTPLAAPDPRAAAALTIDLPAARRPDINAWVDQLAAELGFGELHVMHLRAWLRLSDALLDEATSLCDLMILSGEDTANAALLVDRQLRSMNTGQHPDQLLLEDKLKAADEAAQHKMPPSSSRRFEAARNQLYGAFMTAALRAEPNRLGQIPALFSEVLKEGLQAAWNHSVERLDSAGLMPLWMLLSIDDHLPLDTMRRSRQDSFRATTRNADPDLAITCSWPVKFDSLSGQGTSKKVLQAALALARFETAQAPLAGKMMQRWLNIEPALLGNHPSVVSLSTRNLLTWATEVDVRLSKPGSPQPICTDAWLSWAPKSALPGDVASVKITGELMVPDRRLLPVHLRSKIPGRNSGRSGLPTAVISTLVEQQHPLCQVFELGEQTPPLPRAEILPLALDQAELSRGENQQGGSAAPQAMPHEERLWSELITMLLWMASDASTKSSEQTMRRKLNERLATWEAASTAKDENQPWIPGVGAKIGDPERLVGQQLMAMGLPALTAPSSSAWGQGWSPRGILTDPRRAAQVGEVASVQPSPTSDERTVPAGIWQAQHMQGVARLLRMLHLRSEHGGERALLRRSRWQELHDLQRQGPLGDYNLSSAARELAQINVLAPLFAVPREQAGREQAGREQAGREQAGTPGEASEHRVKVRDWFETELSWMLAIAATIWVDKMTWGKNPSSEVVLMAISLHRTARDLLDHLNLHLGHGQDPTFPPSAVLSAARHFSPPQRDAGSQATNAQATNTQGERP